MNLGQIFIIFRQIYYRFENIKLKYKYLWSFKNIIFIRKIIYFDYFKKNL
jgi:hypothetical protein